MSELRKFRAFMAEDWVILCERTAYIPTGQARRIWKEDRVAVTIEELGKALKMAKAEKSK